MRQFAWVGLVPLLALCGCASPSGVWPLVVPEQRQFDIRDPSMLPRTPGVPVPPPPTVTSLPPGEVRKELALDDAIRIALENSKVIRVLAGVTAVSSNRTVYDPAISNTNIDAARAVFDPVISAQNTFSQSDQPQGVFDPLSPFGARITGTQVDNYELGLGLVKRTVLGGTARLDGTVNHSRAHTTFAPLNPQERSALTLSYTQPLLQGAGIAANIAPIVIARINTERSFFQFKDSVQELVRGVIDGYWAIVFARTDVWARQQQVKQGETASAIADARHRLGIVDASQPAQAKVALSNFRASLIAAESNLLNREAALRNLLGLSPSEAERIIPTTPPTPERMEPKWDELIRLAEEHRPDLIELKLIIEADQQSLLVAKNQAQPRLDATMLYRWNGLEGETPGGNRISSGPGQFVDWTLGVNFSVPLGLRQGRADVRRSELLLARDWANLEQGSHAMLHNLAGNVRNLAQFHEQYKAFREARIAARINLEQQFARYRTGQAIFLNVLQAITDWGNAVSNEAQSLAQYNVELANLERQTGTILETHGIRFIEERTRFAGPLGHLRPVCYPSALVPSGNTNRYPSGGEAPERAFERDMPSLKEK